MGELQRFKTESIALKIGTQPEDSVSRGREKFQNNKTEMVAVLLPTANTAMPPSCGAFVCVCVSRYAAIYLYIYQWHYLHCMKSTSRTKRVGKECVWEREGPVSGREMQRLKTVGGSTAPSKVPFLRCLEPLHYFGGNSEGPGICPAGSWWERGRHFPTCNAELSVAVSSLAAHSFRSCKITVDCKSLRAM